MIQGVSGGASLAQTAIEAALRAHESASKRIQAELADTAARVGASGDPSTRAADFGKLLGQGLREANSEVSKVDALPSDLVAGRVVDFHEIAVQIKQSELTFKFALEVRNKLIDAYRETMRMSV